MVFMVRDLESCFKNILTMNIVFGSVVMAGTNTTYGDKMWFSGERSEFCVTLKILQRHHIIQSPLKING
jgi:hypothetical protein